MAEEKREFKGIWIPKEIWLNAELSAIEKIILAEINSLDGDDGCYASNAYLAKFCQCSESYVSKAIAKLQKLKHIKVTSFDGRQRKIKSSLAEFTNQSSKVCNADSEKENDHNNNNNYNNYNNKKDYNKYNNSFGESADYAEFNSEAAEYNEQLSDGSPKQESKQSKHPNIYKDVIDYLNKKTGKRYRHTTGASQRHIRARQKEGFVLQDFYAVIDVKCSQWLNDKNMSKYLRPETLFGGKFESYLNECCGKEIGERTVDVADSDYDENGVRIRSR